MEGFVSGAKFIFWKTALRMPSNIIIFCTCNLCCHHLNRKILSKKKEEDNFVEWKMLECYSRLCRSISQLTLILVLLREFKNTILVFRGVSCHARVCWLTESQNHIHILSSNHRYNFMFNMDRICDCAFAYIVICVSLWCACEAHLNCTRWVNEYWFKCIPCSMIHYLCTVQIQIT